LKVKVLKRAKNELKLEVEGEGHTFCNLLQNVLLEDKDVEIAGYDLPHPLSSAPIIYIRMRREKMPEKTLVKALDKIKERTDDFLTKFNEAVGKTA